MIYNEKNGRRRKSRKINSSSFCVYNAEVFCRHRKEYWAWLFQTTQRVNLLVNFISFLHTPHARLIIIVIGLRSTSMLLKVPSVRTDFVAGLFSVTNWEAVSRIACAILFERYFPLDSFVFIFLHCNGTWHINSADSSAVIHIHRRHTQILDLKRQWANNKNA